MSDDDKNNPWLTGLRDSGERQEFGTGAVRDVSDHKGRFDLVP